MKKIFFILIAVTIVLFIGCATTNQTIVVRHPNPTFAELDNYGEWLSVPGIGTVWRPFYQANWQPYSEGYWDWTKDGWMWVSNEPYGWIVYHYGYWNYDESIGWIWVPSYDWQPARVRWYHSGGYIGWAPLPPPYINRPHVADPIDKIWIVVPEDHFVNHDVIKYRTRSETPDIQKIRNQSGGRAPDVRTIEQVTNRRIEPVNPIREELTAGNRRIIKVRMPEDRPVSHDIIRNEPTVPTAPTVIPPAKNDQRPIETQPSREPIYQNNPTRPINNDRSIQKEKIRDTGRTNVNMPKKENQNIIRKQQLRNNKRIESAKNKSEVKKTSSNRNEKNQSRVEKNKEKKNEKDRIK